MPKVTPDDLHALVSSGTFDPEWYRKEYPDVARSGLTPEEHYLWIGRSLNRRGSPDRHAPSVFPRRWCVMTTAHTLFLAEMVASNLRRHGCAVEVTTKSPESFIHDLYIVLCPQMFERLPPGERRICYQLEQSVSSRWFTPEYIGILENSRAVLDYSLTNLEFLAGKGIAYPHVFYLPIGAIDKPDSRPSGERYDILFYGDYKSSPRRRRFLEGLDEGFTVKIIDEVFGGEIHELIRRAKFVLNLHYYEGALLEMPRIQECLSLGTPVISELANDCHEYPALDGAVAFFEEGSVPAMNEAIANCLAADPDEDAVCRSVELSERNFEFMFDRFLIGQGFLSEGHVEQIQMPDVFESRMVSISLPETIERRRIFEAEGIEDCSIFNGIRKTPGWLGCGLSYKMLCAGALQQGKSSLTIIEDDVLLDSFFERRFATVKLYLDSLNGDWDIFSGVIASLHEEATVSHVEHFEGIDFVTLNKMTSMVFNIYNRWALQLIANWSPINLDVETNAIDRYLESANLKVIVAHPYIAGHREEVHSTLWNFKNTQYVDMIHESEMRLGRLKDAWLSSNRRAAA